MRIEHIKDSMILVSGGIEWHVENKDMWDNIQCNARRSDFQSRVLEDRSVSVMFQKFWKMLRHIHVRNGSNKKGGTERLFFWDQPC